MSTELIPLPQLQPMAGTIARSRPLEVRFWERVRYAGPDECWEWTGHAIRYGQISLGGRRGKQIYAHRASWIIHRGAIPDGMNVLHHCDNTRCVNPKHLFLGTQADNLRDCAEKGRTSKPPVFRGAAHSRHRRKLTDDQVIAIRRSDEPTRILAARYGMSSSGIKYVRSGRNWSHLGD